MKRFRYTNIYLLVMIVMACLSSCKDYLTIDELDNRTVEEGYYNSPARIEQSVVGIYVDLRRALLSNSAWLMYGEARVGDLSVNTDIQSLVFNQNLLSDNNKVHKLSDWAYFYDVIYNANQTLEILEKANLSAYHYKLYKGESLALKSLAYFYLARIWNEIPSAERNDFGIKLTQKEAITRSIVWSKEAQGLLPWQHLNDDGIVSKALTEVRFSKTPVSLMLAQQQLWLDQSSDALTMLNSLFKDLHADSVSNFGISMGVDRREADLTQRPLTSTAVNLSVEKLNSIYPVGDSRRASMYTISGTTAALIVRNQEILPLYDTKEVKLLMAESLWKTTKLNDAKNELKSVTVGATENYDLLTEQTFEAALVQERRRLLMGQGQRVFDLIRFNKLSGFLTGVTADDIVQGAAYWPLSKQSKAATSWNQSTYWSKQR